MSAGVVIDLAPRLRTTARPKATTAPAYECGYVICSCGYRAVHAQRAGHVRLEMACPVCHRVVSFETFAGVDGLPSACG